MDAVDFRSIGRAAQEALRRRAIVLVEQHGMSQAESARAVGVQRQTVNIWLKRYRKLGEAGLLDGRRMSGRKGKGALTAEEARQVRRWIADKTPDQLKLPFALWTSRAVRELIERRFGQRLGLSTVQLYLKRWGMTPQKPLVRAKQRAPAAVAACWRAIIRRSPGAPSASARSSTGVTRPASRTRIRSAAATPREARRRWSGGPPSGSPRA